MTAFSSYKDHVCGRRDWEFPPMCKGPNSCVYDYCFYRKQFHKKLYGEEIIIACPAERYTLELLAEIRLESDANGPTDYLTLLNEEYDRVTKCNGLKGGDR